MPTILNVIGKGLSLVAAILRPERFLPTVSVRKKILIALLRIGSVKNHVATDRDREREVEQERDRTAIMSPKMIMLA